MCSLDRRTARSRITAEEIDERISAAIDDYHENHLSHVLTGLLARVLDTSASEFQLACKKLESEICKFESELAQLRSIFFNDRAERAEKAEAEKRAPVDLPRLPLSSRGFN